MSWRDSYRSASFRGVPFFVDEHQAEGGRRNALHEYPLLDTSDTEDTGGRTGRYQVTAYVIGTSATPNYMVGRDALLKALRQRGMGQLVHPYLGNLDVICDSWRLSESARDGGKATFELDFHDYDTSDQPTATQDTQQAVADQAALAQAASDAQFEAGYEVTNTVQLLDAQAALSDAFGQLESGIGQAQTTVTTIQAIAAEPAQVTARIDADVLLLTSLAQLRALYGYAYAPNNTSVSVAANRQTLATAVQVAVTIAAVTVSAQTTFVSYDDAIAVRDELIEQLDSVCQQAGADLYSELVALRIAMVDDITTRAADLAKLASYTPQATLPVLAIAMRLYGPDDIEDSSEDILDRNGIAHPGFVPGLVPLEVLNEWQGA